MNTEKNKEVIEARRRFLQQCGRYAVATPPVVALLLTSANRNYAVARSDRPHGNNGFGNGGGDGVPGNSGRNSSPNSGQKLTDRVR
jgi:hypothetical protein